MNIKQFLIDNYIWILVIILLTIVTVIGFLVDRSKNKKNNNAKVDTNGNNSPDNPVVSSEGTPVQSQGVTLNQPVSMQPMGAAAMNNFGNTQPNTMQGAIPNSFPSPVIGVESNQNNNFGGPIPNTNPVNNNSTMPQPIMNPVMGNMQPVNNSNELYQPLSDQKPHFESPSQEQINSVVKEQLVQNDNMINVLPNQNISQPTPIIPQPVFDNSQMMGFQNMNNGFGNVNPVNNNQGIMNQQPQVIPNPMVNGQVPSPIPNTQGNATIPTPVSGQTFNSQGQGYVYNSQNNNQM